MQSCAVAVLLQVATNNNLDRFALKNAVVSAILVFDSTALMNEVLVPADAAVGSVIYRLRASDTAFDYPLTFDLKDSSAVAVEALNCTRFNSVSSLY